MQEKPDDRWATPLCRRCHRLQHAYGDEVGWWRAHGFDPFLRAIVMHGNYMRETKAKPAEVVRYRARKKSAKRPGPKRKIQNRTVWPKRKLRNRK